MGWDGMGWDGMGWDGMGWLSLYDGLLRAPTVLIIIMDFMHQSLHLMSSMLAMNDQILGHTEYKIHLLNYLRFYCSTSEFTVRPQNLLFDLRIYCPTSEFYCTTWVFGSSNFSAT